VPETRRNDRPSFNAQSVPTTMNIAVTDGWTLEKMFSLYTL